MTGNIAPDGAVIKLFSYEPSYLKGPAGVFDSEHAAHLAVADCQIVEGDIVVIRYEGQVGGPSM